MRIHIKNIFFNAKLLTEAKRRNKTDCFDFFDKDILTGEALEKPREMKRSEKVREMFSFFPGNRGKWLKEKKTGPSRTPCSTSV